MWYLCVFYHRLLDYRRPEVESLAELFGAFKQVEEDGDGRPSPHSLQWKLPENHHIDSPFHFVDLPSEEIVRKIANRSKGSSFLSSWCVLDDKGAILIVGSVISLEFRRNPLGDLDAILLGKVANFLLVYWKMVPFLCWDVVLYELGELKPLRS